MGEEELSTAKQRRNRHTPEQSVKRLRDADAVPGAGKNLAEVLKSLGGSQATRHRWRNGHQRRALVRRDEA